MAQVVSSELRRNGASRDREIQNRQEHSKETPRVFQGYQQTYLEALVEYAISGVRKGSQSMAVVVVVVRCRGLRATVSGVVFNGPGRLSTERSTQRQLFLASHSQTQRAKTPLQDLHQIIRSGALPLRSLWHECVWLWHE